MPLYSSKGVEEDRKDIMNFSLLGRKVSFRGRGLI